MTGSGFTLTWSRALGDIDSGPMPRFDFGGDTSDDRIYVGTNDGTVYAFDMATGTQRWSSALCAGDGAVKGFIWPDSATNALYLSTTNTVCSLVDNGTSASLRCWTASVSGASAPLFAPGGGYVWVGDGSGNLVQLDVAAGAQTLQLLGGGRDGTGRGFSAREIEDLQLRVLFLEPITAEHILELKLLTPRGHEYQTLAAPIAPKPAGGRGVTRERRVPSYPRPLPVQVLEDVSAPEGTLQAAVMTMPVAGTSIVTSSLYGHWSVEVLLDCRLMSCEVANFFLVEE